MNRAAKRILPLMLTMALVFGIMAIAGPGALTAGAADHHDYVTPDYFRPPVGVSGQPSEYQRVYFGTNPFEDGSPNAWRVLKAGDGGLFLLSENMVKVIFDDKIDTEFYYGQWEERDWLNGGYQNSFTAAELSAARPQKVLPDYGNKSEYQGSNEETVYDTNGDLFFLLCEVEALNPLYFPGNIDDRAYEYGWFLRSPGTHDVGCIDFVFTDGYVIHDGYANFLKDIGIRPACKLDMGSVFLVSPAVGGKPEDIGLLEKVQPAQQAADVKLTLFDESLAPDFAAAPLALNGNTLTIRYSGAATGEDKFVSAVITGENGRVNYYGKMASCVQAEGVFGITLPEDFNPLIHTVEVFAEQRSGDYKTDYAGTPVAIYDVDPAAVVAISPENGATGVECSGNIVITFSEAMDITTGTVALNGIELADGVWEGNTYTIPYSGLDYNTTYTVSITGFKDAEGNTMADNTANSFTTVGEDETGNLQLTTDAQEVKAGEEFTLTAFFKTPVNSNAAILTFTFDTEKFAYVGFTPFADVSLLEKRDTDTGVQITVMVQGYNTTTYGDLLLKSKDGAILADEEIEAIVKAEYVVKPDVGDKFVKVEVASTGFKVVVPDEPPVLEYNLITLSDMIDAFGATSEDPDWNKNKIYDLVPDGVIDINDIALFASRIGR